MPAPSPEPGAQASLPPAYSVVIPTHNRAHLLPRAVQSVLRQTYPHWELIVVDDGSTDQTEQVIAPFLSDRVSYVKKSGRSGAAESRNVGAAKAKHPYLTFLDSDDEVEPSWLSKLARAQQDSGAPIVCCGLTRYDAAGNLTGTHLPQDLGLLFGNRTGTFSNGGVFALSKALFDAAGGYDEELACGQHTELAIRVLQRVGKDGISNVAEPLVRIHIHGGARIRTDREALVRGTQRLLDKHRDLFAKNPRAFATNMTMLGVSNARLGRFGQARGCFLKAL